MRYRVTMGDEEAGEKVILETDDLLTAFSTARALARKYKLKPYNYDYPGVVATYYSPNNPEYRSIMVVDEERVKK